MHGQTHPASFELSSGPDGRLSGTARLVQSDWGIKTLSRVDGSAQGA